MNSPYEPRLSIDDWIARVYPNSSKPPCKATVRNWIRSGRIRGGTTPTYFVFEDWEPRHGEMALSPEQARLLNKMAG